MKYFLQLILLFFTVETFGLPGRADHQGISFAQFGECKIFFYMTDEKDELCRKFIDHVNEDMSITLGQAALPCPTREILVQAIKYPERDPIGTEILKNYAEKTHQILEDTLGISMQGLNWYMNLNLNWEALKIHHDRFIAQYAHMEKESLNPADWTLVQDLTLIDWQMGENTVAGTMVQDGKDGDRYIISLFPNEIVGTFYTENAKSASGKKKGYYPGHITMPPHSTIAPMDYVGGITCGSSKGKRMSTAVRGIVNRQEIDRLVDKSERIDINRKKIEVEDCEVSYLYPNGAIVKSLSDKAYSLNRNGAIFHDDVQNIHIESIPLEDNCYFSNHIGDRFKINHLNIRKIFLLTKKDGGFTSLGKLGFEFSNQTRIIAVNFSSLPDGYRYFNIAQDWTSSGNPWIQLYDLPPGMAMEIPRCLFEKLSLSPTEELIYRSEFSDQTDSVFSKTMPGLKTQIVLFIYED
ncbi:MAG: hypothetical protein JSS30_00875 [Verrucomicrobia bacterium]|nr:hypothetical protein [Verrucomicrobiota bacterium]